MGFSTRIVEFWMIWGITILGNLGDSNGRNKARESILIAGDISNEVSLISAILVDSLRVFGLK